MKWLAVVLLGAACLVPAVTPRSSARFGGTFIAVMVTQQGIVVRSTLIQTATPDDMRGRVSALNGLFIGTSNELGAFESGAVADLFGPVASVVIGGMGTVVVAGITAWLSPDLRKYGRLGGPDPGDSS